MNYKSHNPELKISPRSGINKSFCGGPVESAAHPAQKGCTSGQKNVSLNKSFWKSRNLFPKRFLAAGGKEKNKNLPSATRGSFEKPPLDPTKLLMSRFAARACFFIIILGISLSSFAEEPLSFKQAVAIALQQNHQIQIAGNNAAIAKNEVNIGNADLLPRIDLSTSSTYQEGAASFSGEKLTTTSAQAQVSYTLFDGLGNIYRFKKLQAGGLLGELEARGLIETTLLRVGTSFYTSASAYENLQIAKQLLAISKERLDRAEKRSVYGRARTIDVLAARVDYFADQVTVTQARFLWDETRRTLNVLLNRPVAFDFSVDTALDFRRDFDLNRLKEAAFANNAAYLSSEKRLRQAGYDVKIARSQFLPRLDFSASYGYNRSAPDLTIGLSDAESSLRVGATLSLNLFNGFKKFIQTRNAKIRRQNRELTLEQSKLELEKDVTGAYESYRNSLLIMKLQEKYVEAAELNFKRSNELYKLGQVTTTQFREAQLNLIRSRNNLSTAKYEAKLDEIELLRLTGQLIKRER